MRKATRIVATSFGFIAGIAGLEHGYFEILQGNIRPASLMFASMGPPCVPERIWNACEPAMTVLPNLLVAGIFTVIFGLLIMIWSAAFVQRKNGGSILILLSIILLLVGGGFFPPLIGMIGGVAGTRINKPLDGKPASSVLHFAAKLWPWPLVIFMVWILGQFPVGYFFNDFLQSIMGFGLLLILTMLPLSVYTGYAFDVQSQANALLTPAIGK
jgi:hypothetical protein